MLRNDLPHPNAAVSRGVAGRGGAADGANLVTAIDVSGWVDGAAERLELLGMAAALGHPPYRGRSAGGQHRRIGFSAFTWSSAGGTFVELVPWTLLETAADAGRVAAMLRAAHNLPEEFYARSWASPQPRPWVPGLATDISASIEHGIAVMGAAPFAASRQLLNICANGSETSASVPISPATGRPRPGSTSMSWRWAKRTGSRSTSTTTCASDPAPS